jgi:hypothetical protein
MPSSKEERDRDAPPLAAAMPRLLAPRIGWIAGVAGGARLVDFRGNAAGC